jgi:hypothetical protein
LQDEYIWFLLSFLFSFVFGRSFLVRLDIPKRTEDLDWKMAKVSGMLNE